MSQEVDQPEPEYMSLEQLLGSSVQRELGGAYVHDGPLMFTEEDVRNSANDPDVLLRSMMHTYGVGMNYFNHAATQYYHDIECRSKDKSRSDAQNLIRTLKKGGITANRFVESCRVLDLDILDLSVTVRDREGHVNTFSTAEAAKKYFPRDDASE